MGRGRPRKWLPKDMLIAWFAYPSGRKTLMIGKIIARIEAGASASSAMPRIAKDVPKKHARITDVTPFDRYLVAHYTPYIDGNEIKSISSPRAETVHGIYPPMPPWLATTASMRAEATPKA